MNKRSIVLGLACGLWVIGSLYGNDFSKNKQKALKYYSEKDFDAAYEYCIKSDQNDPEILQRLAWMYSTGSGVQKNMSKAIVLSKKAANAGNGKSALYYAVWALIPQKKYDDALKYLQIAEKENISHAIYSIGWLYENGYIGNKKNISTAMKYYRKACQCSDASVMALVTLGAKIKNSDPSFAMDCWNRAAKQNYADAYRMLGEASHFGVAGAKIDYSTAIKYYKKAIELADKKILIADKNLAEQLAVRCYSRMADIYSNQLKNSEKAIECYKNTLKYAAINKTLAGEHLREIALLYLKQQQWSDAYKFLEKSASYGNGLAYVDLGIMHATAEGVPKDLKKAKEFFEKAMTAGVSDGFIQMGIMYMAGEGVSYNETKAEECFKRAIEIDKNHKALSYLANLYLQQNKVDKAMPIILAAKKSGETCAQFDLLLVKILERGTTQVNRSLISNLRNTLEDEVKKGNPTASYYLSRYLDSGILGNVDEKRSQQLLRYASDNGECCASCLLAQKRISVAKPSTADIQFAYQYAKKALKQNPNCLNALHLLGTGALVNKYWENPQAGMTYLTEAANKNFPPAALIVGLQYAYPGENGIEKNYDKAMYYLRIAQREPQLQTFIKAPVLWIEMGKAIDEKNIDAQKVLFGKLKKIAEEGNFLAWSMVAYCYESGLGTPSDTQKAKFWSEKYLNFKGDPRFNVALRQQAQKKHKEAMDIGKEISEEKKIAKEIKNQIDKIEVDPTLKNALEVSVKSAKDIPPPTKDEMQCLQLMMQGKMREAEDLALKIKTRYPMVMLPLGAQYVDGKGVPQNLSKAKKYLSHCQMLPAGQYCLGQIYVLEGDFAKAKELFFTETNAGLTAAKPLFFYCSGKIAMKSGKFPDAKKHFEQAYRLGLKAVESELNLIKTMGF